MTRVGRSESFQGPKFLKDMEAKGAQTEQCRFINQTGAQCVLALRHVGPHDCPTDDGGQQ